MQDIALFCFSVVAISVLCQHLCYQISNVSSAICHLNKIQLMSLNLSKYIPWWQEIKLTQCTETRYVRLSLCQKLSTTCQIQFMSETLAKLANGAVDVLL